MTAVNASNTLLENRKTNELGRLRKIFVGQPQKPWRAAKMEGNHYPIEGVNVSGIVADLPRGMKRARNFLEKKQRPHTQAETDSRRRARIIQHHADYFSAEPRDDSTRKKIGGERGR